MHGDHAVMTLYITDITLKKKKKRRRRDITYHECVLAYLGRLWLILKKKKLTHTYEFKLRLI